MNPDLIDSLKANNIDIKFPPVFTYIYEFCPLRMDESHFTPYVLSAAKAFFQDRYPSHVCAFGTVKDSVDTSTPRKFGVGICHPVHLYHRDWLFVHKKSIKFIDICEDWGKFYINVMCFEPVNEVRIHFQPQQLEWTSII